MAPLCGQSVNASVKGALLTGLTGMEDVAPKIEGQRFRTMAIVWAKLRGHAPWPAQITHVNENHSCAVVFFGTSDSAVIHDDDMTPFVDDPMDGRFKPPKRPRVRERFESALMEARKAHKLQPPPGLPNESGEHDLDGDIFSNFKTTQCFVARLGGACKNEIQPRGDNIIGAASSLAMCSCHMGKQSLTFECASPCVSVIRDHELCRVLKRGRARPRVSSM